MIVYFEATNFESLGPSISLIFKLLFSLLVSCFAWISLLSSCGVLEDSLSSFVVLDPLLVSLFLTLVRRQKQ
ncbi:hypothetical protein [Mycoplasmopsis cynos]|uniref:hypothetical protein n=1 Tax=Mycoplasmopsis cynos TaxID=171284 RepID=UPI002540F3C3|nr:hypothetical protein [Mycoplasmopsis cynos]MCU9935476.1 hypothetical protein [Mycoplasmopsis cynos]